MKNIVLLFLSFCLSYYPLIGTSQIINDVFDMSPGLNFYQNGLSDANWVNASNFNLVNHAGDQAFLSANGTGVPADSLGIIKELGGEIQDSVYTVAFFIAKYSLTSVSIDDFIHLRIGGAKGTYQWIHTPRPIQGMWQQWVGIYTPDSADLGAPFDFVAVFNLPGGNNSIAIDGPVTVDVGNVVSSKNLTATGVVRFYPNPVNDKMIIWTEKEAIGNVKIFDVIGKLMYTDHVLDKKAQIDMSAFSAGIYFITAGNATHKFTKE